MNNYLLLLPVLLPIAAGLMLYLKPFSEKKTRHILVAGTAIVTALLSLYIFANEGAYLLLWQLTDELKIAFRVDGLGRFFCLFTSFVWVLVAFYAFFYMTHEKNEERFFCFFLISLGVLLGLDLADNLITMYLFFELVTLCSFPLVLHSGSKESIAASLKYLYYSIAGAFLALLGMFFIYKYSTTLDFAFGGVLDLVQLSGHESVFLAVVFCCIVGFGAKAGMFPLHGWLPTAHPVAPAPASAVLSGVIAKAGVLCIIRIVFYLVGADFIAGTWVQYAWMSVALLTVFMGSMLAYKEPLIKKRFAYSTVSQVSYVLVGLSCLDLDGGTGGLLHVLFHSVIKDGLFMVAGAIIVMTGCTRVDELRGIGKKMPITIWAYTFLALALIGIPPFSGFVSKWYLAAGALSSGLGALTWIAPLILLISALLTAGYLLPITINGFFPGADFDYSSLEKCEPPLTMTLPIVLLAAACLLMGMFPNPIVEFLTGFLSEIV